VTSALRLGEGIGLELELAIVDSTSLDVRPFADRVLFAAAGEGRGDHDNGRISWSNELVRHVLELKTTHPERGLAGVAAAFQANVAAVDALLRPHAARLMPGGMHPWMDPRRETELWPHEHSPVYRAYDRLFDCRRHGWANLQSTHLNLSFGDDDEFGRLHAAVRAVLPLVPALAASSPFVEGRWRGNLDQRLVEYGANARRVPAMCARIVPEPLWTRADYEREILRPLQADVAALEPAGVLQGEWLNARGAIARFDRGAIELRLSDAQECVQADLAVAWALRCVVAALCAERFAPRAEQEALETEPLAVLLEEAVRTGPAARLASRAHAAVLGWRARELPTLGVLWHFLVETTVAAEPATPPELRAPLEHILVHGTLSQRLLAASGAGPGREEPGRAALHSVYSELCACLAEGRSFRAR
jgi:gamma-glutamyl:cysteine ligase YbdK (ATP-grasp superfamily)